MSIYFQRSQEWGNNLHSDHNDSDNGDSEEGTVADSQAGDDWAIRRQLLAKKAKKDRRMLFCYVRIVGPSRHTNTGPAQHPQKNPPPLSKVPQRHSTAGVQESVGQDQNDSTTEQ